MALKLNKYLFLLLLFISTERSESAGNDSGEQGSSSAGDYVLSFSLTNKEASTVLCSVVKHAGSGRARKKCRGKHET